jgi:hypothetical protein
MQKVLFFIIETLTDLTHGINSSFFDFSDLCHGINMMRKNDTFSHLNPV